MRAAVLINRSAGTARKGGEDLDERLAALFNEAGIEASIEFLDGPELRPAAESAAKQAQAKKLDAVIVGGGDGTVRCVASALADTGVPMGILPLGTLNHFARDLGISLELDRAIAAIAARQTRSVDAAEVNGALFINNSSIGIYPFLVLDRERIQAEEGKQKWLAMLLAAWRTLKKFPLRRLRVRAGQESVDHRSPIVFIGNNEYGLGPGKLGARERIDRGELSIYVARRKTRISLFMLGLRTLIGNVDQSDDLTMIKSAEAVVDGRVSRLPVALDGEVEFLTTPLRYRTRPAALTVIVSKEG